MAKCPLQHFCSDLVSFSDYKANTEVIWDFSDRPLLLVGPRPSAIPSPPGFCSRPLFSHHSWKRSHGKPDSQEINYAPWKYHSLTVPLENDKLTSVSHCKLVFAAEGVFPLSPPLSLWSSPPKINRLPRHLITQILHELVEGNMSGIIKRWSDNDIMCTANVPYLWALYRFQFLYQWGSRKHMKW